MPDVLEVLSSQHDQLEQSFDRVSEPDSDRRQALAELIEQLAAHLSAEHSLVIPVVRGTGPDGKRAARALNGDYRKMARLLARIERRKFDSPDLPGLLTELHDLSRDHRRQWDSIARVLADAMPAGDRAALADRLVNAEDVIHTHPHPHLLSWGPVGRITTRLASHFDRARDKTVRNVP